MHVFVIMEIFVVYIWKTKCIADTLVTAIGVHECRPKH